MSRLFAISVINLASEACWMVFIIFTIQSIGLLNYGGIQYQISLLSLLFSIVSFLPSWWPKINDLKYGVHTVSLLLVIHFTFCFLILVLWLIQLDNHEYLNVIRILGISLSLLSIFSGFNVLYYGIGQSQRVLIMAVLKFFSRLAPCVIFIAVDTPDITFIFTVFLVGTIISFVIDSFFFFTFFKKMFPNFYENFLYAVKNFKIITNNFWTLFVSVKILQLVPTIRSFAPIFLANKFVGGDAVAIIKLGQSAFSMIALIGKPYRSFAFANTKYVYSSRYHFLVFSLTFIIYFLIDFLRFDHLILNFYNFPFSLEQLVFIIKFGCIGILAIIMAPLRGRVSRLRTPQYLAAEIFLLFYYTVASSICILFDYTLMPLVLLSYTLLAYAYYRTI